MNSTTLCQYLDDPHSAAMWLRDLGLTDVKRGHGVLMRMATGGMTLDLLAELCDQLDAHLGGCADSDMALNNLDDYIAAGRNPLAMGAFFQRDPEALPVLLQIFSTSQHLSDLLIADPESFDHLRLTGGRPLSRQTMVEELVAEVTALEHESVVLRALRRSKRRETLRIALGDIVYEHPLPTVTAQISHLADSLVEAALRAAWRKIESQRGTPIGPDGQPARFVVIGMGKLGGMELNYSSDIDLIFFYDGEGKTNGRRSMPNQEFFAQVGREMLHLLTEVTELGSIYRVDLRLRPEGRRGPMVMSIENAMSYYDLRGRTWERQAYLKARPVAGDLALGRDFLERLAPWIYRCYLGRADISGIKALKRRIEQQTHAAGANQRDVKTGHGGIRDIEFVIQFLQLLHGADLPDTRSGNTMEAIVQLEQVGCLSNLERTLLLENYQFLRKIEHRLQIMFDLQTHMLPEGRQEVRKLALRMGYADTVERSALVAFEQEYRDKTQLNRKILDHLLHDAFGDDMQTQPEVDLVLDPDPPDERIEEVLGQHGFRDVPAAYRNLMALAQEKNRFLSERRCRHFLAAIAPSLLPAIAKTADPDSTLVNLDNVSDSLGGKGVLWELFSFNEPNLHLFVELCAYSPFLSNILITNPGMIDSLMDSLMRDKLPGGESLRESLADLSRGAEDLDPILHSFKNDRQLHVGVRDLLGKEPIEATTGVLSDIAQTCLNQITTHEFDRLAAKFGTPTIGAGARAGKPCELVILAMGKFGGREMNYHSDLDIVFLYEADGNTAFDHATDRGETTSNQHFFSELGQRIIKTTSRLSAYGRLYEIDVRLRPTGRSGALATTLDEFTRYFAEGHGQLWERQALCKARVVHGSPRIAKTALAAVCKAAFVHPWHAGDAEEIRAMRGRLEDTAGPDDLKRGPGGIVDIEFLVQMLQLRHGRNRRKLHIPNTLAALEALQEGGYLDADDGEFFGRAYRLLRTIEGRLRLMHSTARDQLPDDPTELTKLAHLLNYDAPKSLLGAFESTAQETRRRFDRLFDQAQAK